MCLGSELQLRELKGRGSEKGSCLKLGPWSGLCRGIIRAAGILESASSCIFPLTNPFKSRSWKGPSEDASASQQETELHSDSSTVET